MKPASSVQWLVLQVLIDRLYEITVLQGMLRGSFLIGKSAIIFQAQNGVKSQSASFVYAQYS